LSLDQVPDFLYRVELTTLRWKELVHEPPVVEFLFHYLAVVDREVVHHHDPLLQRVDPFELLNEGEKGVHCVAAKENLRKHKSVVDTQSTNHGNALTPLIGHLDLHSSFDPHSGRLHPEVEGGLIDVDDIGVAGSVIIVLVIFEENSCCWCSNSPSLSALER
jgi:hypothetical protein